MEAGCWFWRWCRTHAGAGVGCGCSADPLALGVWLAYVRGSILEFFLLQITLHALSRQVAGAGAVSWLRTGCWCGLWCGCCELAVRVVRPRGRDTKAGAVGWQCGCVNLCTQHHAVLSLERSLSIRAVGYLHSSGSVLADSCVKGSTVCARAFLRIMFYTQRQAVNRPLFQHVSARYIHNSRAG